jgi:branched-subunit amino acid aminotransferase/4-amino-4-deoxychorismate lyase
LNGVTRRSCLDLAKERLGGDLEVTEHMFTIGEIQEAALEGRLLEAFAAGTAVSSGCSKWMDGQSLTTLPYQVVYHSDFTDPPPWKRYQNSHRPQWNSG